MFCDNLSASLHQICKATSLSHKETSELCGISLCYVGRIIRKEVIPSLAVLEKLCAGLKRTPNELLGFANTQHEFVYRLPMRVTAVRLLDSEIGYPICPRCGCSIDREHQAHCDRCGQRLSWERYGVDTIKITVGE